MRIVRSQPVPAMVSGMAIADEPRVASNNPVQHGAIVFASIDVQDTNSGPIGQGDKFDPAEAREHLDAYREYQLGLVIKGE